MNPAGPNDFQVVSFDLDDTLWDCAPAIRRAETALWSWIERHAPEVGARFDRDAMWAERTRVLEQEPELRHDVTRLRRTVLDRLFTASGHPPSLAERAFAEFYRVRSEVELYVDAVATLEALGRRFRLAAITNGNANLEQIGIAGHFDHVFHASVELPSKPDRAMFTACVDTFGIESTAMLHVGDNVETDVYGAQQAGVPAVWYNPARAPRPSHVAPPFAEVTSLQELCRVLGVPILDAARSTGP